MADQVQGSSKKRKSPDSAVGDQPDPPSRNTKRSKNESTMADKAADFRVFYDAIREDVLYNEENAESIKRKLAPAVKAKLAALRTIPFSDPNYQKELSAVLSEASRAQDPDLIGEATSLFAGLQRARTPAEASERELLLQLLGTVNAMNSQFHALQNFVRELPEKLEQLILSVIVQVLDDPSTKGWRNEVLSKAAKLIVHKTKTKDNSQLGELVEKQRTAGNLQIQQHEIASLLRDPRAQDVYWKAFKEEKSRIANFSRSASHIILGVRWTEYDANVAKSPTDDGVHPYLQDVLSNKGLDPVQLTVAAVCRADLVKSAAAYKKGSNDVKKKSLPKKKSRTKKKEDDMDVDEVSEASAAAEVSVEGERSVDSDEQADPAVLFTKELPPFDGDISDEKLQAQATKSRVTVSDAAYEAISSLLWLQGNTLKKLKDSSKYETLKKAILAAQPSAEGDAGVIVSVQALRQALEQLRSQEVQINKWFLVFAGEGEGEEARRVVDLSNEPDEQPAPALPSDLGLSALRYLEPAAVEKSWALFTGEMHEMTVFAHLIPEKHLLASTPQFPSFLHWCIGRFRSSDDVWKFLASSDLLKDVRAKKVSNEWDTPLWRAVVAGDVVAVHWLIRSHPDANSLAGVRDSKGRTLAHAAAESTHEAHTVEAFDGIIQLLVQLKIDLAAQDKAGATAVTYAAQVKRERLAVLAKYQQR